ncbi:Fc.00g046020.m01.CDS01 [Cosmosporella sp. VM-42]
MEQKDPIRRFGKAMSSVYGPFDRLTEEEAEAWIPPDDPGAGGHRGRYLWTDAFGVVNFITLFKETSSPKYLVLAKRLVETVHDVLGRTRDASTGLPGATAEEPLRGGLRIGKPDASGSDGDGQYHHYLTLWMFALNRLALATDNSEFNDLAIQLEQSIHPRFILCRPSGDIEMVWKISTDMKTVLVPSEGHLDAATGFVVCRLLQNTATKQGRKKEPLKKEIDEYSQLMNREGKLTSSGDTLDLGMGLWICHFFRDEPWAARLGDEALEVAHGVLGENAPIIHRHASRRLAFREFGACLGLSYFGGDKYLQSRVKAVVDFWESHLQQHSDDDLRPISQVMYAAALIPGAFQEGYLNS